VMKLSQYAKVARINGSGEDCQPLCFVQQNLRWFEVDSLYSPKNVHRWCSPVRLVVTPRQNAAIEFPAYILG
jgi:hypothetical protein